MPQWFDPIKETPEGRLLKQVRELMGSLGVEKGDNSELAARTEPRDKVTRGDVIAAAQKNERKGKGTSGDKAGGCMKGMCKEDDCPTCNPKKELKKFDASFNCALCGANPHEECRMPGTDAQAINCKLNPVAYDSRIDDLREENILEHIDEGHGMMRDPDQPMLLRGEKEQFNCDRCGKTDTSGVGKHGYCSACAREGMTGKKVEKSEVESAMQNGVPQYLDIAGGEPARATSYTTNQRYIAVEDGPKATSISEVFKMPSVSQTGYGPTGSTLHMHINDGGNSGNLPNRAPIEESLADLKKGLTHGQEGVVAEIVDLLEQVYSRL